MLLGQDAFSAQPFSASPFLGNAVINPVGANLRLTIGPVGISTTIANIVAGADPLELKTAQFGTFTVEGIAVVPGTNLKTPLTFGTMDASAAASGSAIINPTNLENKLTLRTTSGIVVTGNAVVNVTGVPLTLKVNETGIITWNEIIPGATMVWTPIKPY
jgi:hypothetical protein|tara:strand:- start:821 stop:1300 length:480 start_codon:yes stop_codon:yes gene_type:complete